MRDDTTRPDLKSPDVTSPTEPPDPGVVAGRLDAILAEIRNATGARYEAARRLIAEARDVLSSVANPPTDGNPGSHRVG